MTLVLPFFFVFFFESAERDNVFLQVTTFDILKCNILQFSIAMLCQLDRCLPVKETSSFHVSFWQTQTR